MHVVGVYGPMDLRRFGFFLRISDSLPKLKVSHHPPLAGVYSEGRDWVLYQEVAISSKFRGRYLQIIPQGNSFSVYSHGFIFLQLSPVISSRTSLSQTQGLEKIARYWMIWKIEGKIHEKKNFQKLWLIINFNICKVFEISLYEIQKLNCYNICNFFPGLCLLFFFPVFAWFVLHLMIVYQYCVHTVLATLH